MNLIFSYKLIIITLITYLVSSQPSSSLSYHTSKVDSPPEDLIWCGYNNDIIILLTETSSVYRSKDKGNTWELLNPTLIDDAKNIRENKSDKIGKVAQMFQSPVDPSLIFFLGTEHFSWIVEDCGNKIRTLDAGRPINEFLFHPTERNWALVSAYSLCEDYHNEPCRIVKELYVTRSLGDDWKILGDYISDFSWGVLNNNHILKGIPKTRVLVTYMPRGRGNQDKRQKMSYKNDFVYSDDFFDTKITGVRKGNKFLLTQNDLYVSEVIDQEKQIVQILHADANQLRYEFEPIITNQNKYMEHSFNFLDTSEDIMFLYMNNLTIGSKFGYIYASGENGKEFSISLKNNIQFYEDFNDFEKIESVEGVYLANVISGKFIKKASIEIQKMNSNKNTDKNKKKNLSINYKNFIKTLITHNKGGDWKRLTAPTVDSNGNSYDCGDYCYLHLYSYSSQVPQFYSVSNAPGIIIGNGNVGHYMDYQYENPALFLSRDGGINWYEIKKGIWIYEIGNHGGLLVIAEYEKPSRKIYYSYDEGINWEEMVISDEEIEIKNILIEPESASQRFLVYGIKNDPKSQPKGIVISLDFSFLNIRICSESDYENWSPISSTAKNENNCILGKKIIYSRRKRESKCLYSESYERKITVNLCDCTNDDFQCDIGYHRIEPGDPCTPISSKYESTSPPENCVGYYKISRGYRKIPGNICKGGYKFDPILVACPYNKFLYAIKVILIICVIGAIIGFIAFIVINSDLSLNDVLEGLGSFKPSVNFGINQKVPANYLNLDINTDDNTLFEDDIIIGNKNESKEKNNNEKNKLNVKENNNNNITDLNTEINNIIEEKKENENKEIKEKEEKEEKAIEDDDDKLMN